MRLRIRTLLLAAALLCSMTSTVRACIYIPILEPFYWLFGCSGCHGGYSGYGYANYGPNPYGVSRCIDDWLGYGYLRNQEGTLGHYPGRPISCYSPVFPCLLNPCSWFAPCPLFSPYGPTCGMTAPMVAPLAAPMPVQYQTQWMNQGPFQRPMPGMTNPWGGNCNDPCGSQCLPQPMMQYQPAQVPLATWQPMPVYRGRLHPRRAWHPRHYGMMVPQTQYAMSAPQMQMPMMSYPGMDSGCCDGCGSDFGNDCGCGGDMANMMPGSEYMQGPGYQEMNSGSGCCGSDNGLPQSGFESGMPPVPQNSMLMSPGSMPMARMSPGQSYNIAPYTSMSRWYTNPGYAFPGNNPGYRQSMAARPVYGMAITRQPQTGNRAFTSAMRPMPQSSGWQTVQMMPQQFQPMRSQRAMSPVIGNTMPGSTMPGSTMPGNAYAGATYARPMVAGDFSGDHEWAGPSSGGISIVPNSHNGRPPIQQASWSQPARTSTARRYPNSVQ